MSGPLGLDALHEPAAVTAADRYGLLPAAAFAGAQVRATAHAVADRADLAGLARPRAVIVCGPRAAELVVLLSALAGPDLPVPLVASAALPRWVGPLDVVLVVAGDTEDIESARAADQAQRSGAFTIVRAAAAGPVADAAGSALLVPAVAAPEALSLAGRLALGCAVGAAITGLPIHWDTVADALDAEALGDGPAAESFVNPAVLLALQLGAGPAVLIGTDPLGAALAAHGAGALAELAGHPATVLTDAAARGGGALLERLARPRDIFADPAEGLALAAVVIGTPSALRPGRGLPRLTLPGLPAMDVDPPAGGGTGPTGCAAWALTTALRLDLAAVYLGLVTGAAPPRDAPGGLAHTAPSDRYDLPARYRADGEHET